MTLHSLPLFVRLEGRTVILVGVGEAADAKRRLLERAGAVVVPEPPFASSDVEKPVHGVSTSLDTTGVGDARLAIVVDDEAAVARLRMRGVLVNAVDRPELCDFTLPAIVDRDPVIVAIGTGGASAGLAAALRQRLEALLPAGLGGLATALHAARDAIRARYPDATARRRAISAALAPGAALDPLGPEPEVSRWLEDEGGVSERRVASIRLVSPDPDDLTLRQARLLADADRVTHAADVPRAILERARADAARIETAAPPVDAAPGLTVDVRFA